MDHHFFYNEFVSKIVFNTPGQNAVEKEVAQCKTILKRSSIIDVRFTNGDAVVLERVLSSKTPIWAVVGGLLSLYVGASILSISFSVYLLTLSMLAKLSCRKA